MIREENNQFCVYSEDGSRSFGCYDTRSEAQDRLSQIEYFKDKESRYPEDETEFKRCWEGYESVPGKKPYTPGSCRKVGSKEEDSDKPLNKPFRLPKGSSKKFGVYVKDGDKIKKVTFGDPDMEIRRDDDEARKNFRARHNCDAQTDKTTAAYWSCRMWEKGITVSDATKEQETILERKFASQGILEIKELEDSDDVIFKGYIATTHLDSGNDTITANLLRAWENEINDGNPRANKVSYHHDREDPRVVGVALKGTAKVQKLPDGHWGLYCETLVNKTHPLFDVIKYEYENSMLDSFSIEYVAGPNTKIDNEGTRILDLGTDLHGYTLASRPMNERAVMIKQLMLKTEGKQSQSLSDSQEQNDTEDNTMSDDLKQKEAELSAREAALAEKEAQMKKYEEEKKMADAEAKKKADEEAKKKLEEEKKEDLVKSVLESKEFNDKLDSLAKSNDPAKVESKEASKMSIEVKEYAEIATKEISLSEQFRRAFAVAEKEGILLKPREASVEGNAVAYKQFSTNGNKIEFKALNVDTNVQAAYVDDTSGIGINAAELQDVVDPVLYNALNNEHLLWGLLTKENKSTLGSNRYTFVLQTGRNPTAGAYTGDAVSLGNSTRNLYTTKFKKYQVGVAISGELIAANKGSPLGDVLAIETQQAMEDLMEVINEDLFTEQGAETDAKIIGLKYLADSAGNTSLYGVTRSSTNKLAPDSAGDTYIDGSTGTRASRIRTALRNIEIDGGAQARSNSIVVMSPTQMELFKAEFDNAVRLDYQPKGVGLTSRITEFEGSSVFVDKDCPNTSIFVFDKRAFKVAMWVPPTIQMLGKRADNVEGFVKTYFCTYSTTPRRIVEIYSVPTA